MAAQQTPPGWYTNPSGQLQWWDGYAWGQLALAIIGLRKSAKKRAGVVSLVFAGFAVVAPVIVPPLLVILGFALYASAGISTELSGGTPLG